MAIARRQLIDVAAYAIMNNHYHLVLRIDKETAVLGVKSPIDKC